MSDENEEVAMAECGSCRAIVPIDSSECPECGISFSGVSDEALGECGACNALVPLDSTKCPECGVVFVADDVVDVLRNWMANNKMDVKTLFGRFDTNDDNMIDSSELKDGLLSLNLADLPPSQVDRLIEAIDEDGDSLIDLQELQSIIGGEELEDAEEESVAEEETEEESSLKYNENVLSKVMESSDIDESDKDAFLVFAQDFNADGNEYLKKEELQAAADAWNAQTESEEPETNSVEEELTEEEVEDEESVIEDAEEESDELDDDESDDDESDDEETTSEDPTPDELFLTLAEAIAEQGLTIREVFESMDADLDGQISGPELQKGIEDILGDSLPPATVFAILGVIDEDDDGNIDPMELIQSIEKLDLGIESDRPSSEEKGRKSSEIIEQLLSIIDEGFFYIF